jgi:hypothetical protein
MSVWASPSTSTSNCRCQHSHGNLALPALSPLPSHAQRHSPGSPFLIIHLAWNFLLPVDKARVIAAHPVLAVYAMRRVRALQHYATLRKSLCSPRPPMDMITPLCHVRADLLGCALLLFNFRYGDLLRWMGNTYTCSHRDFAKLYAAYEEVRDLPPNPGETAPDFDRAFRAQSEGVPLEGHFIGSFPRVTTMRRFTLHSQKYAPSWARRRQKATIWLSRDRLCISLTGCSLPSCRGSYKKGVVASSSTRLPRSTKQIAVP